MIDPDDVDDVVTTISVPIDAAGARVDAFLATRLPLSRSRIDHLIEAGRVSMGGAPVKKSLRLRGAETLVVEEPPPAPAELVPEDLPLAVIFEDDDLLVVDKAAGMPVHPGAGNPSGTVANAVRFRCPRLAIGGELRPGIVHRLDKDTSGLLVVCKNDASLEAMARAFAERRVSKRYRAWCLGVPYATAAAEERARRTSGGNSGGVDHGAGLPGEPFDIVSGHRRATGDRRRFTTALPPSSGARLTHTRVTVVAARDGVAALAVELLTGRTHQIRAHLADRGHPLLQDELYGGGHAEKRLRASSPVQDAVARLHRQALHAAEIAFAHPRTGTQLRFVAPLPPDLARVDAAVRGVAVDADAAAVRRVSARARGAERPG